jgi:hypothetical protein
LRLEWTAFLARRTLKVALRLAMYVIQVDSLGEVSAGDDNILSLYSTRMYTGVCHVVWMELLKQRKVVEDDWRTITVVSVEGFLGKAIQRGIYIASDAVRCQARPSYTSTDMYLIKICQIPRQCWKVARKIRA